ncbi:MAG: septal ring lytic transglycosylase RlpA family protein [Acidobacteriaceae bacterium]|nr:septal ring lytic transglycosylase RlpA family protein [Acidobacteriaceae bacterium]
MLRRSALTGVATVAALLLAGCHHSVHTASRNAPEERPDWASGYPPKHHREAPRSSNGGTTTASREPLPTHPPLPSGALDESSLRGKPLLVDTGMASWYGPQFNHKKSADGNVYDANGLTAAHRTLPLGTLARVTNLATNESVIVRITDRGPFVRGRIMDLSEGAAKRIDLYRMGIAKVKIEAYAPVEVAAEPEKRGLWCVQTGAFATERGARDLRDALAKRYATAKVQEFQGPTGFWVRIDPAGREKTQAEAIRSWIGKPDDQADAYLVRLN